MAHAGALILLVALPFTMTLELGLAGLIVASFGWHWRRGALAAPVELHILADGSCRLMAGESRDGRRYHIARATVYAGLVRLRLESGDRRHRLLLIMSDAVEPDSYRQLQALIVQRRLPVREIQPS